MSNNNYNIPTFHGENYDQWVVIMRGILTSNGLWEYVQYGYEKSRGRLIPELDAKALRCIQRGLSPEILPIIRRATKSKEAWDILRKVFKKTSKARPSDCPGSPPFTVYNAAQSGFGIAVASAIGVPATKATEYAMAKIGKRYREEREKYDRNVNEATGSRTVKVDNPYVVNNGKNAVLGDGKFSDTDSEDFNDYEPKYESSEEDDGKTDSSESETMLRYMMMESMSITESDGPHYDHDDESNGSHYEHDDEDEDDDEDEESDYGSSYSGDH